jgi:hypothetical protein
LHFWEVLAFLQQAVSVQHPMPQLEQNWAEIKRKSKILKR